jgi:hypothetical protein
MARIGRVAARFALAWLAACGDDATMGLDAGTDADLGGDGSMGSDAGAPDAPSTGLGCIDEAPLSGGIACAVVPSATGGGISDNFHYHAVGVPDGSSDTTPVFVYFKGSAGIPYHPGGGGFNDATMLILEEGIERGYLVLMLAYDRIRGADIEVVCADDLACYERFRLEVVLGMGDPADPDAVRQPNDIMSRLDALVAYLAGHAPSRFPATIDWSTTRLGGHSQGAGHAGFIAKELRMVAGACLLAGLGDADSAGMPATWLTATDWMTPRDGLRGLIHEGDPWFAQSTAAWIAMGLQRDVDWRALADPTMNPHGFVQSDVPTAVASRAWACFE